MSEQTVRVSSAVNPRAVARIDVKGIKALARDHPEQIATMRSDLKKLRRDLRHLQLKKVLVHKKNKPRIAWAASPMTKVKAVAAIVAPAIVLELVTNDWGGFGHKLLEKIDHNLGAQTAAVVGFLAGTVAGSRLLISVARASYDSYKLAQDEKQIKHLYGEIHRLKKHGHRKKTQRAQAGV